MDRGTWWYRFICDATRTLVFRPFGGLRAIHPEKIPDDGPLIFAPTHMSNFDPPACACCQPRCLTFMAKRELFKVPVIGPIIRSVGAFPVRRGENDSEAIRLAIRLLEEGRAVLVFPEGTRGDGTHMGPISSGLAMLAKRTNARILPIAMIGSHITLPKGRSWPRRHRIDIVFGDSFTFDEVAGEGNERLKRVRFVNELAKRLADLSAAHGQPLIIAESNRTTPDSGSAETESGTSAPASPETQSQP